MRIRKTVTAMFIAGMMVIIPASKALAGTEGPMGPIGQWRQDDVGWWYQYPNSNYPANMWGYINGLWYHFGPTGYMDTGWFTENGIQYYLDPVNGDMYHDRQEIINGITYSFDSSGAATMVNSYKAPVVIPPEEEKSDLHKAVDMMCDDVLAAIINPAMNDYQKLSSIYAWVRRNFSYGGHSETRDWVYEAYQGFRRHRGDCYTYFAVTQALLTRAGYPSIEVIRYTDNDHYWNLTQCDGQWYHFDTTPRAAGGTFCLLTDAQMLAYSAAHRGCFAFDQSLYPPTP